MRKIVRRTEQLSNEPLVRAPLLDDEPFVCHESRFGSTRELDGLELSSRVRGEPSSSLAQAEFIFYIT